MNDWLHSLPVLWMVILVFGFTYLVTAGIIAAIMVLKSLLARVVRLGAFGRPWRAVMIFSK